MKLQAFGTLLADTHDATMRAHAELLAAVTELNSLRRKPTAPASSDVDFVTDVLAASRSLLDAEEVLDVLPAWFPSEEPVGHRVLREQLPVLLRVADRESALLAWSPERGLLVRSGLAAGMAELFGQLWDRATAPLRDQILELMAAGLDDAAVASATGRSIRTVRAHIAAIMTELGADTRLAAGVEAARRGWL
ncbi:hypothetical protein Lesp02_69990 [Lentzea sp. NBRC 105346]|nr:hypothetical protein Lesp02_69990 [Lentzea sp. NBRC 105346]